MLVEMGDIPRPDSSILSKNIFTDSTNKAIQSSGDFSQLTSQDNLLNKRNRSMDTTMNSFNSEGEVNIQDQPTSKRQKYDGDNVDDDEDSFVDAQILSATVVRKPFT